MAKLTFTPEEIRSLTYMSAHYGNMWKDLGGDLAQVLDKIFLRFVKQGAFRSLDEQKGYLDCAALLLTFLEACSSKEIGLPPEAEQK
jgi:hypothetical protein